MYNSNEQLSKKVLLIMAVPDQQSKKGFTLTKNGSPIKTKAQLIFSIERERQENYTYQ